MIRSVFIISSKDFLSVLAGNNYLAFGEYIFQFKTNIGTADRFIIGRYYK